MKLKVFHENEWREYPAKTYAEYTYEWLGEPHESESVMLDSSGHEVARNLNHFADTEPRQLTLAEGSWYWQQYTNAKVEVGKTYTFSIIVDKISDDDVPVTVDIGTSATPDSYTRDVVKNAGSVVFGEREVITFTVTEQDIEGGRDYLSFRLRNQQEATTVAYREVMLEEGDTFGGYLDGDASPSRAWVDFQPRNISGVKRIWRQPTPPPAGTSYEWAGERHDSESIKRVDGEEVARNLANDPALVNAVFANGNRVDGVITQERPTGSNNMVPSTYGDFEIGEPFSAGVWVTNLDYEGGRTVQQRISVWDGVAYQHGNWTTLEPGETKLVKYEGFSPIADSHYVQPRLHGVLEEGYKWAARGFMFNRGPELVDYFDGDTASDRANDLWHNADGVPHVWVNGQGWVAP